MFNQENNSFKNHQYSADHLKIIIWGVNEFSIKLHESIRSDIQVIGFIGDGAQTQHANLNVYTIDHIKNNPELKDIPIVLAMPHKIQKGLPVIDFEQIRQFKMVLSELLHKHHVTNEILHPAALIDFLPISFPNKILTFGFYGSGNTVYNHVLLSLSKFMQKSTKQAKFWELLCFEYAQGIQQTLSDTLYSQGGHFHHTAPWKLGTSQAHCMVNDIRLDILSFATREHITNKAYGYHQIPSIAYLEKLKDAKFNLFFVIRDPLDMLLSLLNKSEAINKATNDIDLSLFAQISRYLINQLNIWRPYTSAMKVLRYEDLTTQPIVQIKKLAGDLKLSISDNEIEQIWETIGFKQLPAAPANHYWRGGSGKWMQYLNTDHLLYLREIGMEDMLEHYGYNDSLQEFKSALQTAEMKDHGIKCGKIITPMGDETSDSIQFLKTLYGDDKCKPSGEIIVASDDGVINQKMSEILSNPYLNALTKAGAHSSQRLK